MKQENSVKLKEGTYVTYRDPVTDKDELGKVKFISSEGTNFWVVFKCGGDWDNYQKYTAQLCSLKDLTVGWKERVK